MAAKPTPPPPAYFLSLSLENVRSFGKKQTISFARENGRPAQWTIILEDNGVGKTTVLKSLAGIRPIHKEVGGGKMSYFAGLDTNWKWWPVRSNRFTTNILSDVEAGVQLNQKSFAIKHHEIRIILPGEDYDYGRWSHFIISKNTVPNQFLGLICYGYGAGRTTGNSTLSETPESVDTCASLFNDRADLLNPEEWFLFADYRMAKDKDPLTIQNFHLIKAALLKIMEEGEVTDLEVAPVQANGGSPRQGVRFKTPYGWVRLRDMSLGYQTLVVWLTDFADKLFVRYPDSKNPLEEPAIVLIDEIDLHLHPSWQRKLLKSLSEIFINTQFIATAHSPLVVQAAGDVGANVVLLRREGDQTVVVTDVEDVRGWRLDQILTSELFGLETARSLDTEKLLKRRAELLSQTALSPADKQDLANLTEQLGLRDQPVGETPSEKQVHAVLRQLRQKLGKQADA